jgi:hypothetical protein
VLKTLIFPQPTTGYTGGAKARLQTISRVNTGLFHY